MIFLRAFGIESYHDKTIPTVDYAENDASSFVAAWQNMGSDLDATIILSDQATLSRLSTELDNLKGRVTNLDTVVFYFAGHGFFINGENRLAATDTFQNALEKSTLPLKLIYDRFTNLGAQKAMMFVDACHSGLGMDGRSPIIPFSAEDLRRFDVGSKAVVLFASCSSDERSYPYRVEQHGYWTTCLLQALSGDIPEILKEGELLYADELQDFLGQRVPQLIRETRTGIAKQTPIARMDFNQKFVVADLGHVMKSRQKLPADLEILAGHIELRGLESGQIKSLSGFVKGHKVYPTVTQSTRDFVISVGEAELDDIFDELYERLHSVLGIDYPDLNENRSNGGFSIITPAFDIYVDMRQNEDKPSEYEIEIVVDSFRDPSIVSSDEFAAVFEGHLEKLAIVSADYNDLKGLVSKLSKSSLKKSFKYVPGSFIEVYIEEFELTVQITTEEFIFSSLRGPRLKSLLDSLLPAVSRLTLGGIIKVLPAER